jgi:hypothetical protein
MTTSATIEAEIVPANTQPLILKGEGYGLEISPAYELKKTQLLNSAALIARVNNPDDDSVADTCIKSLAAMRIEVEKSRTAVKAPAIKFGKDVDEKAKSFSATIEAEETRLKKIRGDYATMVLKERQRVLAEMEAARQAEAKRIRDEEAAAAKIEAARIAAEQAAFDATTPEEDAAATKAAEEAKAAELKRLAEAAKIITAPATVAFVPAAPKGVKMIADYVIEDLDAVYRANPQLVTLTERRKEILEFIAAHTPTELSDETLPSIPGLCVFLKAQVR